MASGLNICAKINPNNKYRVEETAKIEKPDLIAVACSCFVFPSYMYLKIATHISKNKNEVAIVMYVNDRS